MNTDRKITNRETKPPTILNTRLQEARESRNETQQEISEKVLGAKNNKLVSWYETTGAMPPFDRLTKLATHYNVSLDYLFGLTNIKQSIKIDKNLSDEIFNLSFSNNAINNLKEFSKSKKKEDINRINTLNKLLENPNLLDSVSNLIDCKK